jgi:Secretion system C-terminal sorting domain
MNKNLFTFLLYSLTLFSCLDCFSQNRETIFYDSLRNINQMGYVESSFAEGQYIYLSGNSYSETNPLPSVTKIDTSGNTIWTASSYTSGVTAGVAIQSNLTCTKTIKSNNKLFTIAYTPLINSNLYNNEVWAIFDSSGTIIWKRSFPYPVTSINDFNSNELIVITDGSFNDNFYYIIDKDTGEILFRKTISSGSKAYVDNSKNVLIYWRDSCEKYRENRLINRVWTSHLPNNGTNYEFHYIKDDTSQYLIIGNNYARAIDTLNGSTKWIRPILVGYIIGQQSGIGAIPRDIVFSDSSMYVTWVSRAVGSIGTKLFTLSKINKKNGSLIYNVSHDFVGIPASPSNNPSLYADADWPYSMAIDKNKDIYITGSYDYGAGPENPANFGIMKINGISGSKLFEATITNDSTKRFVNSKGKFIYLFDNKFFVTGNLQKANDYTTSPIFLSFDTGSVFKLNWKKNINYNHRYPSYLQNIEKFKNDKFFVTKKIGKYSTIEMYKINGQKLWSKTFQTPYGFIEPSLSKSLFDTSILASFIQYKNNPFNEILKGAIDSILFVKLDSTGNSIFQSKISQATTDTIIPAEIYTDKFGVINFLYYRKAAGININNNPYLFSQLAYNLNGNQINSISIGLPGDYTYSKNIPLAKLTRFLNYNKDTLAFFRGVNIGTNASITTLTNSKTGAGLGGRILDNFEKVYSTIRLDSSSFYVMGRNVFGKIYSAKYNYNISTPKIWENSSTQNGSLIFCDTSNNFIYSTSVKDNGNLLQSKINKQNGVSIWSNEFISQLNTILIPSGACYNFQKSNYTLAGSKLDTVKNRYSYFYQTLDTLNNIVNYFEKNSLQSGISIIKSINSLQNGINIYGGETPSPNYGQVGFLNFECNGVTLPSSSVNISSPTNSICQGSSLSINAILNNEFLNPSYQWQVNSLNVGTNNPVFSSNSFLNNDTIKVIMNSSSGCIVNTNINSNLIILNINNNLNSSISISGNSTVLAGNSSTINIIQINGGNNPTFQWQDSSGINGWQNISGATTVSINYVPNSSGVKLRCLMKSSLNCIIETSVKSNTLTFTVNIPVNPITNSTPSDLNFRYYPNPVNKILIFDSINLSEKWETLELKNSDGRLFISKNINNKKSFSLDVSVLSQGIYFITFRRKEGSSISLKFIKV